MLTKLKNIRKKKFKKKSKIQKPPERMAQGMQPPKFETNMCISFRDTQARRTDGRTDEFRFHELC